MTSLGDIYESLVGDDYEPDYDSEPEPLTGADDVDRMLRHVARIRRQRTDLADVYAAELIRLDERRSARDALLESQEEWFLRSIEQWHRSRLELDPRGSKTIELPNGTLKARAQMPAWRFDDEFLSWALTNADDLVRHKPAPAPEVDKTAAKKKLAFANGAPGETVSAHTDAGEIVPGVHVELRGPTFTVEVDR